MKLLNKEFKCHFIIYVFFIIIKITQGQNCPKDRPIKKNNVCVLEYCTYRDYFNRRCLVDNPIIKSQWINDLRTLGSKDFRHLSVSLNSDDDLILESSYDRSDVSTEERQFYGIHSDGIYYFYDINTKTPQDFLTLNMGLNLNRKASEIFPMAINGENNYILNLGSYVEIYDHTFVKDHTLFSSFDLFNVSIFSERNALFKIDDTKLLYGFISENILTLFYINFTDPALPDKYNLINYNNMTNAFPTYIVSCFDTYSVIECFYRNSAIKLEVGIYDKNNLDTKATHIINNNECNLPTKLFLKCIHLGDNIGVYAYYTDDNNKPLLQLKQLNGYNLDNYLSYNEIDINYNSISISSNYNNNDLIKLNNTKFAFITVTDDDNVYYNILLFVFDIFDNDKIENRLYKIPFYNFYGILPQEGIRGLRLNNNLGIGFTGLNITFNETYTYFMFFSYPNGTDHHEPESRVCINDNNKTIFLNRFLFIENNLFGLEIKSIKILDLPDGNETGLYFYTKPQSSDEEPRELEINDVIGLNDSIIIQITKKLNRNYSIEYAGVAYDPSDYQKYNSLSDAVFLQSKEGSYTQKWYVGRRNTYTFSYYLFERMEKTDGFCCHENCTTNQCVTFGIDNENYCLKCKDGLYYNETEYFMEYPKINNCIPPQDRYWLNKTRVPYVLSPCYENCQTCQKPGDYSKQNCITCIPNFYKIENENTGNCYGQQPINHFLNLNLDPPVYSKCNKACNNCTDFANSTSTNCEDNSCNFDDEYFSYFLNPTNCVKTAYKHYLDEDTEEIEDYQWKACYDKCDSCIGNFSAQEHNCTKCITGAYFKNGTHNCYEEPLAHHYLDKKTKTFMECSSNCDSCAVSKDNCTSCPNGTLFFNKKYHSHNFCRLSCPEGLYWIDEELKCDTDCKSEFYSKVNRLCTNCHKLYDPPQYFNLDNRNAGCIPSVPERYIYDPKGNNGNYTEFGIVEKCYSLCETCLKGVSNTNATNQKCSSCISGNYLIYGTNNCATTCDITHDNYYYHDTTQRKCINCKKENINKPGKKIYKFIDGTECIDEQTAKRDQNFYIIDDNTGTIGKCHKNCTTCFSSPIGTSNNCLTCDNSRGFYIKQYTNDCISPTPDGYYIDQSTKEYRQCRPGCKTCTGYGVDTDNKCLTCYDDYYFYYPYNSCIYNCDNYYLKIDECLDESCFYHNKTYSNNNLQLYYNPYASDPSDKCSSCNVNKYQYENIYICLNKCSDLNIYGNNLNRVPKYRDILQYYYYDQSDEFYYYIKNNKNENETKICYPHFTYIKPNYHERIKASDNFTNTYFNIFFNNDTIDYTLFNKLFTLNKAIDFNYNGISYTLVMKQYDLFFYSNDNDISYVDMNEFGLYDPYILKWDKRDPDLYSNHILFNIYKRYDITANGTTRIFVKKEKYSIIYNSNTVSYVIESPINENKINIEEHYYFKKQKYDIYDILDDFYDFDCNAYEYNNSDINLQVKVQCLYKENITQNNCVYNRINYIQKLLVETCYLYSNNTEYNNYLNKNKERLSTIQNNSFYKNNNYHLKIITCYNQFLYLENINNFLFIISAICLISKIVLIIIFHCRDVSPIKEVIEANYIKRQITVQEERTKMVEIKPPEKKNDDLLVINQKKKYNYIVAVVKAEDDTKKEDQKNDKNDTLKNMLTKRKKHSIKNIPKNERQTMDSMNNDIEYFEYDMKMKDPPKQFREKKYKVDVNKIIYELKEENQFENDSLIRFLLEHIPITSIIFLSTNSTGYRRFRHDSHFSNAIFFLTILSTLVIFNLIFFNDNLLVIKYENKSLPVGDYISYSIYSSLINTVFGFFLIIMIFLAGNISAKNTYNEEDFDDAIKSMISIYRCKNVAWQFAGIILGIISLYYLTVVSNMYRNTRIDLFIQILLSFIFENVFYCIICLLWWIFLQYIYRKIA